MRKAIIVLLMCLFIVPFTFAANDSTYAILDLYTAYPTTTTNGGNTRLDITGTGADTNIIVKVYLKDVSNIILYEVNLLIDETYLEWVKLVEPDAGQVDAGSDVMGYVAEIYYVALEANILGSTGKTFAKYSLSNPAIYVDGLRKIQISGVFNETSGVLDEAAPDGEGLAGLIQFKTKSGFSSTQTAIKIQSVMVRDNLQVTTTSSYTNYEGGALNRAATPVPVELMSFNAVINDNNKVTLDWTTASETNNYGFYIERSSDNVTWEEIGFVNGSGNSEVEVSYSYIDNDAAGIGTYYYRFKQVDFDGTYEYSNFVSAKISAPVSYSLSPAYPNPFNPSTNIKFGLKETGMVKLVVYNTVGQVVKTLLNEEMPAGSHSILFDAGNLASGVYFYKLEVNGFTDTKKIMLLK